MITKMGNHALLMFLIFSTASSIALASDPSPLQDFCVAELNDSSVAAFVNGKFCKDPSLATADDFYFAGLNIPRIPLCLVGSNVTTVAVNQIPGLNTLGISMARIDYAPFGQNPPHTHPRATEIITVLNGTLLVGFITSNPKNRLLSKILNIGDVFVFPQGLIHFEFNVGATNAVAIASFSSQNPGVVTIANAVFGSVPEIYGNVLSRAFHLDKKVVHYLQAQIWKDNNV